MGRGLGARARDRLRRSGSILGWFVRWEEIGQGLARLFCSRPFSVAAAGFSDGHAAKSGPPRGGFSEAGCPPGSTTNSNAYAAAVAWRPAFLQEGEKNAAGPRKGDAGLAAGRICYRTWKWKESRRRWVVWWWLFFREHSGIPTLLKVGLAAPLVVDRRGHWH